MLVFIQPTTVDNEPVFHACFLKFFTIQDVLMTIYDLGDSRSK